MRPFWGHDFRSLASNDRVAAIVQLATTGRHSGKPRLPLRADNGGDIFKPLIDRTAKLIPFLASHFSDL